MKNKVMALLAAEQQRFGEIPANSPEFENWREKFYDRLVPYLREEFPRDRIEKMLTALLPPDEPGGTVEKINEWAQASVGRGPPYRRRAA